MSNQVMFGHTLERAEKQAAVLTEAVMKITKDKISLGDGSAKAIDTLKDLESKGIKLKADSPLLQLSAPGNASGGSAVVGQNTFEIQNQLIQDYAPDYDIMDSWANEMLPMRNVDAVQVQQDIYSSNYGWSGESNGTDAPLNVVPFLTADGFSYEGYLYSSASYISGYDLIALRELGTSDTKREGLVQRLNLQQILLVQQTLNAIELNRLESLIKGSFTYQGVPVSSQLLPENITTLSQSLGSYVKATNKFTPNAAMTINPLVELGTALTRIKNTGAKIKYIVVDNISYTALMNCAAIQAQTQYVAMNSSNDVMGVRRNLFRLTTIPALQGVDILVDDRSIKFNAERTSPANTRPVMWGKEVSSSSFRAMIVTEPSGLSKVGDAMFFPNLYARSSYNPQGGSRVMTGPSGNVALISQDLAQFNATDQRIQMVASACFAPAIYLPNMIYLMDWNVTVS